MTEPAAPQPHDFRRPTKLDDAVDSRLRVWLRACSTLLPPRLAEHLNFELVLHCPPPETTRPDQADPPGPTVGFRLWIGAYGEPTLLLLRRDVALTLVESLLGQSPAELLADRPLTTLEISLLEMLIHELCEGLREAQPTEEKTPCQCGDFDPAPELIRTYTARRELVCITLELETPFGRQGLQWYVPEEILQDLLDQPHDAPPPTGQRDRLLELSRGLPLEIAVRIGAAELDVSELQELQVGDVLMLDQRVTDPLPAEVAGRPVFRGWPGRVGARQAFRIETVE